MALAADTVWEVDANGTGASYLNGGGFAQSIATAGGGTGQDLTLGAPVVFTTLVTAGSSTTISCSGDDVFTQQMEGNVIAINLAGTLTYRQITAVATPTATSATVDLAISIASASGGRVGGAFTDVRQATHVNADVDYGLGNLATPAVAGNDVYVKNATYSVPTPIVATRGGDDTTGRLFRVIGYSTSRKPSNRGTKPILQHGAEAAHVLLSSVALGTDLINLTFDGASKNTANMVSGTAYARFIRCSGINAGTSANFFKDGMFLGCDCTGTTGTMFNGGVAINCKATTSGGGTCFNGMLFQYGCIAVGSANNVGNGFQIINYAAAINCTAYRLNKGFTYSNYRRAGIILNCLAHTCGAAGGTAFTAEGTAGYKAPLYAGCAAYNCAAPAANALLDPFSVVNGAGTPVSETVPTVGITLTSEPCMDVANGDFRLNDSPGGGGLLRHAGWSDVAGTAFLTKQDIGAYQVDAANFGRQVPTSFSLDGSPLGR